jgi:hypothetical protein
MVFGLDNDSSSHLGQAIAGTWMWPLGNQMKGQQDPRGQRGRQGTDGTQSHLTGPHRFQDGYCEAHFTYGRNSLSRVTQPVQCHMHTWSTFALRSTGFQVRVVGQVTSVRWPRGWERLGQSQGEKWKPCLLPLTPPPAQNLSPWGLGIGSDKSNIQSAAFV